MKLIWLLTKQSHISDHINLLNHIWHHCGKRTAFIWVFIAYLPLFLLHKSVLTHILMAGVSIQSANSSGTNTQIQTREPGATENAA